MKPFERFLNSPVLDVIFRLVVMGTLLLAFIGYFAVKDLAECQDRYNETVNARTRIITDISEREREIDRLTDESFTKVWLDPAVLKPMDERTPEETARIRQNAREWIESIEKQRAARIQAATERSAHPVPPPPSQFCG